MIEELIWANVLSMKEKVLEICVDSLQSAITAEHAGADRIELCSCLEVGGLTPDPALFLLARAKLAIPIHVLIRPRIGNFVYDEQDKEVLFESIKFFKKHGSDGLVLGALTTNRKIDLSLVEQMVKAVKPLPITFHRAFDQVRDPLGSLSSLIDLEIPRLLTSGNQIRATDGLGLLRELHDYSKGRIEIMAGGGINSQNVGQLLKLGLSEIHASARQMITDAKSSNQISMSSSNLSDNYRFADYQEIATLRKILDNYGNNSF